MDALVCCFPNFYKMSIPKITPTSKVPTYQAFPADDPSDMTEEELKSQIWLDCLRLDQHQNSSLMRKRIEERLRKNIHLSQQLRHASKK